jgi:alpha-galactosidase
VWEEGPLEIWTRPLADGSQAVGLFNRGEGTMTIQLNLGTIGFRGATKLRDLWEHKDLGTFTGTYSHDVPSHGVVFLRASK